MLSSGSLILTIDDLNHVKDEWTVQVAEVPTNSRIGSTPTRNAVAIYKCTKEDLQSQIDVLVGKPDALLTSQALDAMEMAGLAKGSWQADRHQSPFRKAATVFQTSMTTFSRFLESFSGIVEIAKAADQQYGGLAYGTLSVMLCVFVHKTQREEALDEGFEELNVAFPRLQTVQSLRRKDVEYAEDSFKRLEKLILTAFSLVVQFAKEAAVYYKHRSRRIKDIFRTQQAKDKILADIRRTLNEVRNEGDILMLARLTSLQLKVDEMSISVERIHVQSNKAGFQLTRAQTSYDTRHLADLREILGVREQSVHTDLAKYKALLTAAFFKGQHSKHCHARKVSMELLRADDDFDTWWKSPKSRLLLAGGVNFDDDHTSGSLNWLSYGAVLAVEELRRQKRNVAFFLAQTGLTVNRRKRCSSREIIATLVYQIAEMHDDLLRSKVDKLKAAVKSPAWRLNSNAFMAEMQDVLRDVFSAFPSGEEIYIVIDRLDQCSWEFDDGSGDSYLGLRHAIERLLSVAAKAFCHVKVLLTVDATASQKLAKTKSALSSKERKALLLKAEWCQTRDEGRSDE